MKYAYLDSTPSQILHIHPSMATAVECSRDGKVVATSVDEEIGFPIVDGREYFYYHATGECFVDGNRASKVGQKAELPEALKEIVEQL